MAFVTVFAFIAEARDDSSLNSLPLPIGLDQITGTQYLHA